ncbi:MAG: hypothetical protein HOP07_12315 [Bacteriovoracaceae bacterium]|nr:hypothetical protein [Bacteriovoracaceae bacterium]
MLKYISKTLLIAIIAGSLVGFQTTALYAGVTASKGETTTDSKGVITAKKNYNFDKVSDSDMLASLGMLAAGFITGRMIKAYTPVTTDVMIAGAAGAAFIAGEVLTNMKFKGTIDAMTIEVQKRSDAKVNEEQIQRLMDLKKSYEEAKSTTKTKKTLQQVSAVAFGVAAAWATYLAITEEGLAASCNAALTASQVKLDACIKLGAVAANPEFASCGTCKTNLTIYSAEFQTYLNARKVPAISSAQETKEAQAIPSLQIPTKQCQGIPGVTAPAISKAIKATCGASVQTFGVNGLGAKMGVLMENIGKSNQPYNQFKNKSLYTNTEFYNLKTDERSIFEQVLGFIVPEAKAGWLPLLGLGAGTAVAFFGITGATATQIDMLMFVPQNRAIAFAALGAIALLAANSSANVMAELDENIKKIDSILADLNKLALGAKSQNVSTQNIAYTAPKPATNNRINFSEDPNVRTPCMTENTSTNCKPLSNQIVNTPGFGNLPESFRNIASQSVKVADGLSGTTGISGSTMSDAENLAKKQSAVNALLKDRQAALTKITNGKFQPKLAQDKFLDNLKGAIKRDLRSRGMTATGMMASIGASPIDSSAKPEEAPVAKPTGAVESINVAGNGEGEAAPKEDASGLNLDFSEAPAEGFAAGGSGANSAQPEYDVTTNEIGKENGPSLFEVISSRYLKSGYSKLLEEEPTKK